LLSPFELARRAPAHRISVRIQHERAVRPATVPDTVRE
jgi:hypothetical protein